MFTQQAGVEAGVKSRLCFFGFGSVAIRGAHLHPKEQFVVRASLAESSVEECQVPPATKIAMTVPCLQVVLPTSY